MDWAAITDIIVKLGISSLSIFGMIYVVTQSQKERQGNQKVFMDFIATNNHSKTELIEKSTEVMVEVKNVIQTHTEVLKELYKK